MIPVLTFFAVTSTPGINAPEASATVPLRTALTWANAEFKAATYSKTIDKVASFITALSSSHRRPPIDFSAGIYHLLARATMRPVSTVAALPKAAKRRERIAQRVSAGFGIHLPRNDAILISDVSVRCTGHLLAISSRRARCSSESGPVRMISRSILSSIPCLVSQSAQSAA